MGRCHAQAHVVRAAVGCVGQRTAGIVGQDADRADQVDAQVEADEPLAQNVRRQSCTSLGPRAGVRDLALGQPAAFVADVDLVMRGPRMAAHPGQRHAVVAERLHFRLADVGHHVGRQVGGRVVHFIEQLLLHGRLVDKAAGAFGLADRAMTIGGDFGDGKADVLEPRHVLVARVGEVAAADLGAAFQQVAGHRRAAEYVPVVGRPAEVRHRRPDGERRVGHPATDHDLRAGIERSGDRLCADVGIGADDAQAVHRGAQRLVQQRLMRRRRQVVALHHRDARRGLAEFTRHAGDVPRRGTRVGRAEVADDADAVRQALGQHRAQQRIEQGFVAGLGVGAAAQLGQRERALGQGFEDEEGALARRAVRQSGDQRVDHGACCIGAVARKAGGAADQQGRAHEQCRRGL